MRFIEKILGTFHGRGLPNSTLQPVPRYCCESHANNQGGACSQPRIRSRSEVVRLSKFRFGGYQDDLRILRGRTEMIFTGNSSLLFQADKD